MPDRRPGPDDPRRTEHGARLRAAREALNLTQQQVADRLGVARHYVADLEAGRRIENAITFLESVKALGFDPAIVTPGLVDGRRRKKS